jgi:hypothetical protein
VATLGVLTAYIFAGACIFSLTEGWNILDGKHNNNKNDSYFD